MSLRQPSGDSEEAARGPAKAQAEVTHAGVTCRHVFPALYFHHGHNFHMTCHSDRLNPEGQEGVTWSGNAGQEGTGAKARAWAYLTPEVKHRKKSQQK